MVNAKTSGTSGGTASAGQLAVLTRADADHGPLLVYGGPRTGKTTLAVELAVRHLESERGSHRLTVLSASRVSAARMRESIAQRWAGSLTEQPSRSWASYAFWLIGEARRRQLLSFPARMPRLLSGAEQDRIIAELLRESQRSASAELTWPSALTEALPTDGFRKEVREFFDRVTEFGLGPERLRELGWQHAREEWVAAAELYERYLDYLDQAAPDAFDPAGLISTACSLLERHPELLDAERERLKLLVVDDAQEMNPGMYRLLRLVGAGSRVVAFASPDTAVQGFRGARPEILAGWATEHGMRGHAAAQPAPEVLGLDETFGEHPAVSEVYSRIVRRIGVTGQAALARTPWEAAEQGGPAKPEASAGGAEPAAGAGADSATDPDAGCTVHVLPSDHLAEQMVLHTVLERHHRHGIPLEEIAVISRSGSAAQRIGRLFQSHGVAVERSMNDVVLHREPSVEPLLRVMGLALHPDQDEAVTQDEVMQLLGSVYAETNSLQLRRLRQELLRAERSLGAVQGAGSRAVEGASSRAVQGAGSHRTSQELLLAALLDPEDPVLLQVLGSAVGFLASGIRRVALMMSAARQAVAADPQGVGPEEVLWAVWSASGVADAWAERTRHPGPEGQRADRDLDAVMALFQTAERFADQNPGAPAGAFVEYLSRIELPMDTLADTSHEEHAVRILTPATAAGTHADTVVLVGLQEGSWPNVQLRGELLGTAQLGDVVEGRTGPERRSPRVKQMHVLQDEYRLLAASVSRARSAVIGVAVDSAESVPSSFADLVEPPARRAERRTPIPRPITAGSLIAELRRQLEEHGSADTEHVRRENESAARALADLAAAGVPGADPAKWWGLADLTSQEPILSDDETIRISPSKVQTALESPLQWFTEASGGVEPTDFSRQLGTLVHAVAEAHPAETDIAVLTGELDRHWHELGLGEGWVEHHQRHRAVAMLERLVLYYGAVEEAGREPVAQELALRAEMTIPVRGRQRRIDIAGTLDRVERTAEGGWYVVDLKTGQHKPTDDEMETLPQLGIYQLLVMEGALDRAFAEAGIREPSAQRPAGAAILNIGKNGKKFHEHRQAPATGANPWPYEQLHGAAEVVSGASFDAVHHAADNSCRVGVLCPLCDSGKQVTEP